jgi:hypothetical protein
MSLPKQVSAPDLIHNCHVRQSKRHAAKCGGTLFNYLFSRQARNRVQQHRVCPLVIAREHSDISNCRHIGLPGISKHSLSNEKPPEGGFGVS